MRGIGTWVRCGVAIAAVSLSTGCRDGSPTEVQDVESRWHQVEVRGAERGYRVYTPASVLAAGATTSAPLLLVFHGATQNSGGIALQSWLYPAADAAGMIVAYPEAAGDYWNTPNSPPGFWNIPDVPFADAVIDDVAARHPIDRSRVYAAGYSNGAVFAQVLGCLRGDAIAAIAVVGAGISSSVSESCPFTRPIPTTVFFGDRDPQFFWDDGLASGVGMLGGLGSGAWLAENNRCDTVPAVTDLGRDDESDTGAELWRYENCDSDVDFYRIIGGGHTWPGSPINMGSGFGRTNRSLDASATMVDFFLAHPLPDPTDGGSR